MVMKVGLEYSQPFTFAALRGGLGAVCLFVVLVALRRPLRPQGLVLTAVLGLLQTGGSMGLAVWALESGGAGKISVLMYTMPFWLLLMAWVFLGERLRRVQWVAVGLALFGLILILSPWDLRGWLSSLLGVAGAVCWAGSAIAAKVLGRRHQVDLLSMTAWQLFLGSLPLVLVAALTWSRSPTWSGAFVAALAYNVVVALALALVLWFYILRALPAGTAGLGSLLTPVVGVAAAWIQLGERPGLNEAVGITAIVGALFLTTWWEIRAGSGRSSYSA